MLQVKNPGALYSVTGFASWCIEQRFFSEGGCSFYILFCGDSTTHQNLLENSRGKLHSSGRPKTLRGRRSERMWNIPAHTAKLSSLSEEIDYATSILSFADRIESLSRSKFAGDGKYETTQYVSENVKCLQRKPTLREGYILLL